MIEEAFHLFLDAIKALWKRVKKKKTHTAAVHGKEEDNQKETFDSRIWKIRFSWKYLLFHGIHIAFIILLYQSVLFTVEGTCEFMSCFVSIPVALILFPLSLTYIFGLFVRWSYAIRLLISLVIEAIVVLILMSLLSLQAMEFLGPLIEAKIEAGRTK